MKKLILLFLLLEFSAVACTRATPQPGIQTTQPTPSGSATPCKTPMAQGQPTTGSVPSGTLVGNASGTTVSGTAVSSTSGTAAPGNNTSGQTSSGTGIGDGTISPEQVATQQALFNKANRPGPTFGTAVVDTGGQTPGAGSAPSSTAEMSATQTLPPGPGAGTTPIPTNEGTPVLPVNPGPKGTLVAQPCP